MGQELIALNGNEQFPYQLKPNDIANAMGLPNGIAPGGYNSDGAITTTSIANSSGEVLLEDNAWNNVVEVSGETTSITLPSSDPTNAIINFYPKTPPSSDPNSTWSLEANSGQYLYSPTTGITGNTTTSINVPYNDSLTVLSRGNGEIDLIGGTYLLTNNIAPSFKNPLTIPPATAGDTAVQSSQVYLGVPLSSVQQFGGSSYSMSLNNDALDPFTANVLIPSKSRSGYFRIFGVASVNVNPSSSTSAFSAGFDISIIDTTNNNYVLLGDGNSKYVTASGSAYMEQFFMSPFTYAQGDTIPLTFQFSSNFDGTLTVALLAVMIMEA